MYSTFYGQFLLNNYLTTQQHTRYLDLEQRLQRIVDANLVIPNNKNLDITYLIFDILKACKDKSFQETVSNFLATLLESSHLENQEEPCKTKVHLCKTLELIKNGGESLLFSCAATQKTEYYSAHILIEIVESLHTLYQKNDQFPLSYLPCYDEGGKELIAQLLDGSFQATRGISSTSLLSPTPFEFSEFFNALNRSATFDEMKSIAIRYFSSLSEHNRSSMQGYSLFFKHLQNEFNQHTLNRNQIIALIKLTMVTTSRPTSALLYQHSIGDLNDFLKEAQTLCDLWGDEMLFSICESKEFQKEASFNCLMRLLECLNTHASDLDFQQIVDAHLENFKNGEMSIEHFIELLENQIADTEVNLDQEASVIGNFRRVKFPLSDEELTKIESKYAIIQTYCSALRGKRIVELTRMASEIKEKAKQTPLTIDDDEILKLIAIGRLVLKIKFSTYPYNTQILALLGLLLFEKGSIAQIKTGEGKSIIVALLAFVLGMQNKRIHIVSSSSQLAIRDQKHKGQFFKNFGFITTHICEKHPSASFFQGDIIFGTASDYKFGILREMLNFEILFPEKFNRLEPKGRFDVVIIDEADNLTIDTALHGARKSFPAEISHDWVYAPIFQFVQSNFNPMSENLNHDSNAERLKRFLNEYMNGRFSASVELLTNEQLKNWLISAHTALYSKRERETYLVMQEKNEEGQIIDKIVIIDAENTGQLMHGMRWNGGVHEFLEVKHGIKVETESLTPLSLSNPLFYQMYKSCFGVSGTLGEEAERNSVKEIYQMASFDVPPHNTSQRVDAHPVIFRTDEEQIHAILNSIRRCRERQRPVLIICKTIKESEVFGKILNRAQIPFEMFNEVQQKNEEEIIDNAGYPGVVTLATNNAGRGTDIKLKGESLRYGGLHVILTFYPESQRVEDQARGRGGRQGQEGSSEILLSLRQLNIPSNIESSDIFGYLASKRKMQADIMKRVHRFHSQIDRYVFTLASHFFSKLADFHKLQDNHKFLNDRARMLSARVIIKKEHDLSHLYVHDRQIARNAITLLTNGAGNSNYWKALLIDSIRRIEKKMIADWAVHFYHPMEELIRKSDFYHNFSQEVLITQIVQSKQREVNSVNFIASKLFEEALVELQNKIIAKQENLSNQIRELFEAGEVKWNKYLDPSGVMYYIREITGLSLKYID